MCADAVFIGPLFAPYFDAPALARAHPSSALPAQPCQRKRQPAGQRHERQAPQSEKAGLQAVVRRLAGGARAFQHQNLLTVWP